MARMHTSRTIGYSHDTERTLKRTATQLFVDRQQHGRHARHARTHARTQARAYVGTHARTHPPARPRATRPPAHPRTHAPITHPCKNSRKHARNFSHDRSADVLHCCKNSGNRGPHTQEAKLALHTTACTRGVDDSRPKNGSAHSKVKGVVLSMVLSLII